MCLLWYPPGSRGKLVLETGNPPSEKKRFFPGVSGIEPENDELM
jgi:hypothetical protein